MRTPALPQTAAARIGFALALSAALCLPTLFTGRFGDDFILQARWAHGDHSLRAAADLYRLVSDDGSTRACIANGRCAWFSDPAMRLALFRPLSSLLFVAELEWPAWLAHLASLLGWLALLFAVARLLQRTFSAPLAGFALLVFAVDDCHWMSIGWLSNQHALLASVPVVLGLLAHLRFREEGWRPGAALAWLGYALGLLFGETALQALALPVAYELLGRTEQPARPSLERLKRAAISLAPLAVLLALYLAAYRALGYGARHHDQYIDPLSEPVRYMGALVERLPILFAELFGGLPSELSGIYPALTALAVVSGLLAIAAVLLLLRLALPRLSPGDARGVRWLGLASLLALLPGAAGPLGSRVLLIPSIGGAAITAAILLPHRALLATAGLGVLRAAALRIGLAWLAAVNLVAAPLLLPIYLYEFGRGGAWLEALVRSERDLPGAPNTPDILLLSAPDLITMLYPPILFDQTPGSAARAWWTLSVSPHDLAFTRTGERSFKLEVLGGELGQSPVESFFRSRRTPLPIGETLALQGISIKMLDPSTIEVRAARSVDDPSLRLCELRGGKLAAFPIPAVGVRVVLPREKGWLEW